LENGSVHELGIYACHLVCLIVANAGGKFAKGTAALELDVWILAEKRVVADVGINRRGLMEGRDLLQKSPKLLIFFSRRIMPNNSWDELSLPTVLTCSSPSWSFRSRCCSFRDACKMPTGEPIKKHKEMSKNGGEFEL
jgi:hypothetical protein